MEKNLNSAYQAYIRWRSYPQEKTDPQSNDEFCKKYGITTKDLLEFINKDTYQDDLLISSLNWAKSKTPELLHIVYAEVKLNKEVGDLEKFMNLTHEIKRKDKDMKGITNFNFFTSLKDDQYENIIRREAESLNNGREETVIEFLSAPKS